jgi:site-specific DNA recombinase
MKKPLPINGPDPAKPVGIWIRVSTEDQAKGESPEHHLRRARAYAEGRGWKVREVYHLEGVSGKSVREHPEAKKMLGHVASGHISGLIFSKLARLARNTRELLDFADYFRDHSADLISLHESIDTTSPAGRLFYTMIAAMAQWEREEIAERVAASVPIRAKLGKSTGGAAPYGYQWKDRQLIPHPEEASVRRLLYELFLEHKRKKAVARILNERGYRTRSGAKWSDTTVERLVRDPTAKGLRRANYTRSRGDGKAWDLKPESEWVHSTVEAIVPEDLWAQCNAILDDRRAKAKPPAKRPTHLFAGVVACHCGGKMYADASYRTVKYICRACRNKITPADLEAVFHEQLKSFFLSPEEVASYVGQADEEIHAREERLGLLQAEEGKVRAEMDKVYRLYMGDHITPDGFGRSYRPLEERLKQLQEELPRLQGEVDFMKVQFLARDEILSGARDLYERWPQLAAAEKRAIIEAVVEAVRVGRSEVEIDLAYFPGPAEVAGNWQRNHVRAAGWGIRSAGASARRRRSRSTPPVYRGPCSIESIFALRFPRSPPMSSCMPCGANRAPPCASACSPRASDSGRAGHSTRGYPIAASSDIARPIRSDIG